MKARKTVVSRTRRASAPKKNRILARVVAPLELKRIKGGDTENQGTWCYGAGSATTVDDVYADD